MSAATPEWMEQSRCLTATTQQQQQLFSDKAAERGKAIASLCSGCPVRLSCLSHALDKQEIHGVWGGCDELEIRRALWLEGLSSRRRLKFPKCPGCKAAVSSLVTEGNLVECVACTFSWEAESSAEAVRLFWRQAEYLRRRAEARSTETASVAPVTKLKARVPKGRIGSSGPQRRARQPIALSASQGAPESLVASAVTAAR